jgi:hypothetical protein
VIRRRVPARAIQSPRRQRLEGPSARSTTTVHLRLRRRLPRRALIAAGALAGCAALAVASATPVRAAFAGAKLPGLAAGHIWSVVASPTDGNLWLAGTDQGVYRSADAGATWTQSSLKGTRVWSVGFDARDPHPAFAGLDQNGVSRSEDGGKTWVDASDGLTNRDVRSLAFGLQGLAVGTRSGVAVSADGRKWRTAGLDGWSVSSLAVAANQPQLVLVAGTDGGPPGQPGYLFRNNGAGITWETLQSGLPATAVVSSVSAGALPTSGQPRPLLVTTNKGTYHSGDGGTGWTSSTGTPEQVSLTASAFSPQDPNLAYVGADAGGSSGGVLMRSTDAGASFAVVADALPDGQRNVTALTVVPGAPPAVVAAVNPPVGGSSVYHGADAGAPAPAGAAVDAAGAALASAVPTPKPTPAVKATPKAAPAPAQSTGFRHVVEVIVRFPFPLILEILAIALIAYLVVRWRQRYLDVEGPP